MSKMIRAGALALTLVGAFAAIVLFSVQQSSKLEDAAAYGQDIEAAVLKEGSRGNDVKTVQDKLRRWGYYKGSVDAVSYTHLRRTQSAAEEIPGRESADRGICGDLCAVRNHFADQPVLGKQCDQYIFPRIGNGRHACGGTG